LLVAGDVADSPNFSLYSWTGRFRDRPIKIAANLTALRPEAIVPLSKTKVLVLSDDGTDACKDAEIASKQFHGRVIAIPQASRSSARK
jgi:hypothetical protein